MFVKTPQARMVMLFLAVLSFVVGSIWELGAFLVYIVPGVLLILYIVLKIVAIVSVEVADSVSTRKANRRARKLKKAITEPQVRVTKDLSSYTPPKPEDSIS